MSAIRGRDSKPEMFVRKMIHAMGFRYRLHRKDLPGKPDLVFTSRRKVIFVHGCYWHVHDCHYGRVMPTTRAEFWAEKRSSNVRRDQQQLEKLESQGWAVLVVWECEVRDAQLHSRIERFLDG